jgi:hypothetical protein
VKRSSEGSIVVGDEWPEDNYAPPAHNPVHSTGPFLDFSKFTESNRGYTAIARAIISGDADKLDAMFAPLASDDQRRRLANLVMTGGARPLHMCGMSRGGDSTPLIAVLLKHGAEVRPPPPRAKCPSPCRHQPRAHASLWGRCVRQVNALDNYELTPVDRLASNHVHGNALLKEHGGVSGRQLRGKVPDWTSETLAYNGPGEA